MTTLALLALVVPTSALQLSGGQPPARPASPHVAVRDVASSVGALRSDGRFVLFAHAEAGTDRNGDGDATDTVFAVHDLVSGGTQELGLAGAQIVALSEGRAVVLVDEAKQGGLDLNGDGLANDHVFHGVDLASATATASGLAGIPSASSPRAHFVGARAVLRVSEVAQGADLDGNGAVESDVPFVWDDFSAAPVALPVTTHRDLASHRSFLLIRVAEDANGDRNGDGDDTDEVLHAVDLDDPSLTLANTGLAAVGDVQAVGSRSAFLVSEWRQSADQNGDGDEGDDVLHLFDVDVPELVNTGYAVRGYVMNLGHGAIAHGSTFVLTEEAIAFVVSETHQAGSDLDADGAADGHLLFVHDFATQSTTGTGLTVFGVAAGEGAVAFEAIEDSQSGDLDGDGELQGLVAHLFDLATLATTNLGLRTTDGGPLGAPFAFSGRWLALGALEAGADQNGDGDGVDRILHLVDLDTGEVESQHVSARSEGGTGTFSGEFSARWSPDGLLSFRVFEADEGRDLNRDGDLADSVAHYLLPGATPLGSGFAAAPFVALEPGFARRHPVRAADGTLRVVRLRH